MGISKVNFGGDTLIDLTNDSVDAASLLKGKTAHNAAGEQIVGEIDDGKDLGGGASTSEGVSYTNAQLPNAENVKTALDELVPKSHSHANKDALDKISVSNGKLQYNGSNVVPNALKNPNALTIKIGSATVTYDGSTTQTVTIDDGTEVKY